MSVSLLGPWAAPFPLRQSAGRSNASDINTDLFPCDEFDIPSSGRAARLFETASNAGVPGIACLTRRRTQTIAEVLQTVRHNQAGDVFHTLVAELTRHAQPERTAVPDGKIPAVHAVGEKRLRVQRVGHVDAVPPM